MNTKRGIMIMKNGKGWGCAYEGGGHGDPSTDGWMAPELAKIYDPRFITKPTDVTYKDSPYIKELIGAQIVQVERAIVVNIIGVIDPHPSFAEDVKKHDAELARYAEIEKRLDSEGVTDPSERIARGIQISVMMSMSGTVMASFTSDLTP